jgi:hypothetical protein
MFGFLDNQWLKRKKNQHIWGNTCITLDGTKPHIPNRAKSDDHNPQFGVCPSDFVLFVKLQLFCARVHNPRFGEAKTKG